jgi:hypothetical protein
MEQTFLIASFVWACEKAPVVSRLVLFFKKQFINRNPIVIAGHQRKRRLQPLPDTAHYGGQRLEPSLTAHELSIILFFSVPQGLLDLIGFK